MTRQDHFLFTHTDLGEEDGENARDEDSVEGSCPTDGDNGGAEALYFAEIQEVSSDQRPQASGDVGEGGERTAARAPRR
jgi:hypothetical protein